MRMRQQLSRWSLVLLAVASMGAAESTSQLVDVVKSGDLATAAALLKQRIDVNVPESDGTTALHWAAHHADLAITEALIRAGANVNAANRYGIVPLVIASSSGNAATIEALLNAGADPNAVTPEGEPALLLAARSGQVNAVKTLLAHGVPVNIKERSKGQTALMWATAEGHPDVVELLVGAGAEVTERSTGGMSPLLFAVRAGDRRSVETLLKAGANINDAAADGSSAVTLAIMNTHYDLAVRLLDLGADPNAAIENRGALLHVICYMRGHGWAYGFEGVRAPDPSNKLDTLDVAKALLEHGADPNPRIQWKERFMERQGGDVRQPANFDYGRSWVSFVGATPFWFSARAGDLPMMRLLASQGADPRMPTVQGVTPLMAAAGWGFWAGETPGFSSEYNAFEAVKLAVELGNDINAVADYGNTPKETDSVVLLGRHFLDLSDALGDMRWSGGTALHAAAFRGANTIVRWLVDKGAKLDAKNKIGWLPVTVAGPIFEAATEKHQPQTVALLRTLMTEKGLAALLPSETLHSVQSQGRAALPSSNK